MKIYEKYLFFKMHEWKLERKVFYKIETFSYIHYGWTNTMNTIYKLIYRYRDLISPITWSPSCRSPFCSAGPHCTVYGLQTPGTDPDSLTGALSCPPQDPQTTPWGMWRWSGNHATEKSQNRTVTEINSEFSQWKWYNKNYIIWFLIWFTMYFKILISQIIV